MSESGKGRASDLPPTKLGVGRPSTAVNGAASIHECRRHVSFRLRRRLSTSTRPGIISGRFSPISTFIVNFSRGCCVLLYSIPLGTKLSSPTFNKLLQRILLTAGLRRGRSARELLYPDVMPVCSPRHARPNTRCQDTFAATELGGQTEICISLLRFIFVQGRRDVCWPWLNWP